MTHLYLKSTDEILAARSLERGGAVQRYIDNAALAFANEYVPVKTGALRDSGFSGGGVVGWSAPYARRQYYENNSHNSKRGRLWFERMKAERASSILKGACSLSGGHL